MSFHSDPPALQFLKGTEQKGRNALIPKYVRDYMLEQGADEEDIQILLTDGDSIAKSLFMEATYAKLGLE